MKTPLLLVLCLLVSGGLIGCASTSSGTPTAAEIAANLEAFDQIQQRMQSAIDADANKEDLAWYASAEYSKAAKALAEAKEYYAKFSNDPAKMTDSGIFDKTTNGEYAEQALAKFERAYQAALSIKENVRTVMATAFENRDVLAGLNASEHYNAENSALKSQFKQVVDLIAVGKAENAAKPLADLEAAQHKLEVKLVTKLFLTPANQELARQKKAKYNLFAPMTLARAEASVQAVRTFIGAEPRNKEEIQNLAAKAEFNLQRSEQITKEVKRLKSLEAKDYESYVLDQEARLHDLGQTVGSEDYRNLNFVEQSQRLQELLVGVLQEHSLELEKIKGSAADSNAELQSQFATLKDEHQLLKQQKEELTAALATAQTKLSELGVAPAEVPEETVAEAPAASEEAEPVDQVSQIPAEPEVSAEEVEPSVEPAAPEAQEVTTTTEPSAPDTPTTLEQPEQTPPEA